MRKAVVLAIFLLATQIQSFGQPGQNPGGGGAPGTTPITGIEILIGIGSLFGAKKLINDARKKKN